MSTNGGTSLSTLIRSMEPILSPTPYVYLSIPHVDRQLIDKLNPVVTVTEDEGITLVVEQAKADVHNLRYSYVSARISLKVHSSLEAVGLTAAFAGKLAQEGISANVVAGFYHDHLFVAWKDAERALETLKDLSRTA